MSAVPEFFRVSMMFRELTKEAGPAGMEEALECLASMLNGAHVRLKEIGSPQGTRDLLNDAWILVYDAKKAVQP